MEELKATQDTIDMVSQTWKDYDLDKIDENLCDHKSPTVSLVEPVAVAQSGLHNRNKRQYSNPGFEIIQ